MMHELFERIACALIARARQTPYFHIFGRDGSLYMARYWLVKPRWWTLGCGARIHCIARPDADRHLHDHPWPYVAVILQGGYFELQPLYDRFFPKHRFQEPTTITWHGQGEVLFRRAGSRHRLDLPLAWREGSPRDNAGRVRYQPAWTLFIFGPRIQTWGFYTAGGKIAWQKYLPSDEVAYQREEHAQQGVPE